MLLQNSICCRQTIPVTCCKTFKSIILRKCVNVNSTRWPFSTVDQLTTKKTKHFCTNEHSLQQSHHLPQQMLCNRSDTCQHERGFCVLKPSRPAISSGYFSENRDGIVERLREKSSLKVSRKVKIDESSKSSVLLPFCLVGGEPSILLTLRSLKLNSHRGQVSFPGGRMDKEDPNEIHTALREMEEELGISSSSVDVWGELPPILDRTLRLVHPVLGFIGDIESLNMQKSQDEVAAVFTMSLAHLCDVTHRKHTLFIRPTYSYSSPVFLGGDHRLWGLSAVLLNMALEVVLPNDYTPLKQVGVMYTPK